MKNFPETKSIATNSVNYFAVVKMTREEKIKMYMKLPKKQIAEMLATCNEILENRPIEVFPAWFNSPSDK